MTSAKWPTRFALLSLMTALLAACGGEDEETAAVDDDPTTVVPPGSNVRTNQAPTISGAPPDRVMAGALYQFRPQAADSDGDALAYTISNRPPWAVFDRTNGRLQGIPGTSDARTYQNITISVTDGQATASLKAFSIAVGDPSVTTPPPAPPPANSPPTISGTPPRSVLVGNTYSFVPTARDSNDDALAFSIANRPAWATFNSGTGRLQGAPAAGDVGNYANVTIRVSDGTATVSLAPFSIDVVAVASGSATLSWSAPTQNQDGSVLTNLAGYTIHWGTSSRSYTNNVTVNGTGISTYVIENLVPGTYYFAMSAFTSTGLRSDFSNEGLKTIQ